MKKEYLFERRFQETFYSYETFTIEADSEQEAIDMFQKAKNEDKLDEVSNFDYEVDLGNPLWMGFPEPTYFIDGKPIMIKE